MAHDTWYFAYGSNLSMDRKEQRTGTIRNARLACLKGYRFAFNKKGDGGEVYANIMQPSDDQPSDDVVWGVAYLCNPQAMRSLDEYEGVDDRHYRRKPIEVETSDGELLKAEAYIAGEDFVIEESIPTRSYLERILTGAREHGLPEEYIKKIEHLGQQH